MIPEAASPATARRERGRGPLAYLGAVFTEPFVVTPEDVLTLPPPQVEARRRSGLLRLILFCVAVALVALVIPVALLGGANGLFLVTLLGELALAALCLVLNRSGRVTLAGALFVYGSLALGLDFALLNPDGLDTQSVLIYSLLALVALIAGLILPLRVVWITAGLLILVTILGVLLTPLSTQFQTQFHAPGGSAALRVNALALLVANQALSAIFSWMYARSASAGAGAAARAVALERELTALKDQFLIDANHELRTPIMAWYNNMELLLQMGERATPEQRERFLQRALSSGDTVLRLLASVLDTGALEASAPQLTIASMELAPLVRAVVETFDPTTLGEPGLENLAYQRRDVRVEIADGLCVLADADRVRQVLVNLLTNALKYSERGTPVLISAQPLPTPKSRAPRRRRADRASAPEPPRAVWVGVRDFGLGVPRRDVGKLFNRFVRLERDIAGPVRGTGVGLYLCRVLVEAMGGRIWVESAGVPGEGSTFAFTLPLTQES